MLPVKRLPQTLVTVFPNQNKTTVIIKVSGEFLITGKTPVSWHSRRHDVKKVGLGNRVSTKVNRLV